jgi:hypothetical protein
VTSLEFPFLLWENNRRVQLSLGYGDNQFKNAGSSSFLDEGIFASAGIDVLENLGFSVGWGGAIGFNSKVSFVPWRGIPLSIDLSANNLTNHAEGGRSAVFSLSWGGNFLSNP